MTKRTLVFSDSLVQQLRSQLPIALGSPNYWKGVPRLRLLNLLAIGSSPEFARATYGDEDAAVLAFTRDVPVGTRPESIRRVAELFLQRVSAEQEKQSIPAIAGLQRLLETLDDEILPQRLAEQGEQKPLVIALRGLSGCGKSNLAQVICRTGFRDLPRVGLLAADSYLARVGRDPKTKKTAYRTEDGDVSMADPINADDPVGEVKRLMWVNEFRDDFAKLSREHRVIVVDGGYGELMLDLIGVPAQQRFVLDVFVDSGSRFDFVKKRAAESVPPERVPVRIMNDVIVSIVWYSILLGDSTDPECVVYPNAEDRAEELLVQRAKSLGRELLPDNANARMLRQFNQARDPRHERTNDDDFEQLLIRLSAALSSLRPEELAKGVVEVHGRLPDELAGKLTVPQLQIILGQLKPGG